MTGDAVLYDDAVSFDTSAPADEQLQRKVLHADEVGDRVKIVDAERGIVEILVSVTGNTDSDGERFRPGSWKKWLRKRRPKGVHAHSWSSPTARALEAEEVMPGDKRLPAKFLKGGWGALRILAQYNLGTQRGRDSFSDILFFGKEAEFSVGFYGHKYSPATEAEQKQDPDFVRWIDEAECYEWSDVLFGANPETTLLSRLKGARQVVVEWMADMARAGGVKEPDQTVLDSKVDELMRRFAKGATMDSKHTRRVEEKGAQAWERRTVAEADLEPNGFLCGADDCTHEFAVGETFALQPLSDGVFLCVCEEHAEPAPAPVEGEAVLTITLNGEPINFELLSEAIAEELRQAAAAAPAEVKLDDSGEKACGSCSAKGVELLELDGAGYCEDCTKAMRTAADEEIDGKGLVPFPIDALAESVA